MLFDKLFIFVKNPKYDRYQRDLQWFIKFFHKKHSGAQIKNESKSNEELAEKLCKPIIRKI